jgi:hypothetical protein
MGDVGATRSSLERQLDNIILASLIADALSLIFTSNLATDEEASKHR